ncbi:hypothetical protein CDAR_257601 [Caerostris darwini]|uniref:Uncharacterized protein n=1 Tax=Caerostris darwini TaxID=1538125 RepID=A0AAV4TAP4_9ARAC|nr:hypothetical protein CDAR_257601 [Caerostris darwini]
MLLVYVQEESSWEFLKCEYNPVDSLLITVKDLNKFLSEMLFADLQEKRRKRKKSSFLKSFRSTRSIRQNPLQVCFGAEFGDESVLATPASRSGPKKAHGYD